MPQKAVWQEAEHPRGRAGRFADKPGTGVLEMAADGLVALRRLNRGLYESPDGRFRVEAEHGVAWHVYDKHNDDEHVFQHAKLREIRQWLTNRAKSTAETNAPSVSDPTATTADGKPKPWRPDPEKFLAGMTPEQIAGYPWLLKGPGGVGPVPNLKYPEGYDPEIHVGDIVARYGNQYRVRGFDSDGRRVQVARMDESNPPTYHLDREELSKPLSDEQLAAMRQPLLDWAKKAYPHVKWELDEMSPAMLKEMLAQFHVLSQDFPEAVRYGVRKMTMDPGEFTYRGAGNTWAHVYNYSGTMSFNPKYWTEPSRVSSIASMAASALRKRYPKRRRDHVWGGMYNTGEYETRAGFHPPGTGTPAAVLTHEFGHVVDFWLGNPIATNQPTGGNIGIFPISRYTSDVGSIGRISSMWENFKYNRRAPGLSQYAKKNESERVAEGFASVYHTPEQWQVNYTKSLRELLSLLGNPTNWRGNVREFWRDEDIPEDERAAYYAWEDQVRRRLGYAKRKQEKAAHVWVKPHEREGHPVHGYWRNELENAPEDTETIYKDLGLDDHKIISGIRAAVEQRPERLTHGNTGENAFFLLDGIPYGWKEYNKIPDKGRAVPVHSHSPDGLGSTFGDDYFEKNYIEQPLNATDIWQWFRAILKGTQGPRQALLTADGKVDILGITPETDIKAIKMSQNKLRGILNPPYATTKPLYDQAVAEGREWSENSYWRELLRDFAKKYGFDYREGVRWATPEEAAHYRTLHPEPSIQRTGVAKPSTTPPEAEQTELPGMKRRIWVKPHRNHHGTQIEGYWRRIADPPTPGFKPPEVQTDPTANIIIRNPQGVPPILPWKDPPKPQGKFGGHTGGFASNGMSVTDAGDLAEKVVQELGVRSILQGTKRQNPLDAQWDHSPFGFEIKSFWTTALRYKAGMKASDVKAKRAYAKKHGLIPAMMMMIMDRSKGQAHVYWREGIGNYRLRPGSPHGWHYAGTVKLDAKKPQEEE